MFFVHLKQIYIVFDFLLNFCLHCTFFLCSLLVSRLHNIRREWYIKKWGHLNLFYSTETSELLEYFFVVTVVVSNESIRTVVVLILLFITCQLKFSELVRILFRFIICSRDIIENIFITDTILCNLTNLTDHRPCKTRALTNHVIFKGCLGFFSITVNRLRQTL